AAPAAAVGRTDIGRLAIGAVGDATVLELAEGEFEYRDVLGETRKGRQRLKTRGLVVAGRWWHPPRGEASGSGLFRRRPLGLGCAAGGVTVDLGLDRSTRLAEEILVVLHGEIVAGAQQIATLLEMRVDEARHQLVVLFRGVPVGPVLR